MDKHKEYIDRLIRREGGWSDRLEDAGGPTKYGITLTTLRWWRPEATLDELKYLTTADAKQFYQDMFWTDTYLLDLPPVIQEQMFDITVHSGEDRAVKLLQETILQLTFAPISNDGEYGPITHSRAWQAANMWGGTTNDALADHRICWFADIVHRKPNQAIFLRGWINRALRFKSYCVEDN